MSRVPAILFATLLAALPLSLSAEGDGDVESGINLIEEGARLLLKGLAEEMQPMMEDLATEMEPKLREFAEEMAPMLEQFDKLVDNLDLYHAPERLPNGDIILRRKVPLDPTEPVEPEDEGEVDI